MLNFDDWINIYPEHLWLEIPTTEREFIWEQVINKSYANKASRHRSYINHLCLHTFLNWFQQESDFQEKLQLKAASYNLEQRWEFVDGIELTCNDFRLVLIPSENGNIREFRIPREWVDIREWVANYYLPIQLNIEEGWLRVWGFISYQQVREKAEYDFIDSTYWVKRSDILEDINNLWLIQEISKISPYESLRILSKSDVDSLTNLSEIEAEKIIQELSKSIVHSPRLDIDFSQWGTIISSPKFLEILYEQRIKNSQLNLMVNTQKAVQDLSLWFENKFNESWESIDSLLNLNQIGTLQFRGDSVLNEVCVKRAKIIDLGLQLGNKSVVLLIALLPQIDNDNKVGIRVQLYPVSGETYLPASLKLTLLSESGKTLQSVESRSHDNYIQLRRFKLPLGKFFSIQVGLKDVNIVENFVLEGFAYS